MSYTCARVLVAIFAVFVGMRCGGADSFRPPRFVAVHNAMTSMGHTQWGPIHTGSLEPGGAANLDYELEGGRCYTFVAFGASGVRDIGVRVRSPQGDELGRDRSHDAQAATEICPEAKGRYGVAVRAESGGGTYMLGAWAGDARRDREGAAGSDAGTTDAGSRVPERAGTCDEPRKVKPGRPIQGDTRNGTHRVQGSCTNGRAPEHVYRVDIDERAHLSADLESSFDGALYLLEQCGDAESEIACNDDARRGERRHSHLATSLEAGTYYLVVDGYGVSSGNYQLIVSLEELRSIDEVCEGAMSLAPGDRISSTTENARDYFQATCAGGAASPERVHRLDVPRASRVRLRAETDHDGALYLREVCDDPTTELACSDDFRDPRHSLITDVVEPGRYYVYVDGYSGRGRSNAGNYNITAELEPDVGSGVGRGESCAEPRELDAGSTVELDTFSAQDDLEGGCGGKEGADVVYRISVDERSRLRAVVRRSEFAGVMYVRSDCGELSTERRCAEIPVSAPRDARGGLSTQVDPGTYYLVIDGDRPSDFGAARLEVRVDALAELEARCDNAPTFDPDEGASGNTLDESGNFSAGCASGADSNDILYRLELDRPSNVRLTLESEFDGALHLRAECLEPDSEIACNDDFEDNRHSRIETELDRGTYFVIVDGYGAHNAGRYELDAEIEPR